MLVRKHDIVLVNNARVETQYMVVVVVQTQDRALVVVQTHKILFFVTRQPDAAVAQTQ